MEEELIQSLKDVGYEGPLIDLDRFQRALEKGTKSVDFTCLVSWLTEQLALFGAIDERVHPTTSPEDSNIFLLELRSFLKELGCVNTDLIGENASERLVTKQECILLLEYLIIELMASKMCDTKQPDTAPKFQLIIHESDTAKCLKDMLVALQFGKPPDNVTVDQLFSKLENKLITITSSVPSDLLGKPLVTGELSPSQWDKLDQLQVDMMEEYKIRREMLLKRLDVTIQSFLWSDRIKTKEDEINSCYHSKRDKMFPEPNVSIAHLLAARDDLAIIEKTSNATVRKNTKSNITKVIIGDVPDRGGRIDGQHMSLPSQDKKQNPGYRDHKNVTSNFGQNRNEPDSSQSSKFVNSGENYHSGYQRGGGGGRGGGRGGRGGGYNRGRGGRVQGGWAQGGGSHYSNRGSNRSQYY